MSAVLHSRKRLRAALDQAEDENKRWREAIERLRPVATELGCSTPAISTTGAFVDDLFLFLEQLAVEKAGRPR